MDETLGLAAVDFGGRAAAVVDTKIRTLRVGDLQAELVYDFFEAFARGARANVHARVLYGRSQPSQDRSAIQGLCPSPACSLLPRPAIETDAAQHEGTSMIAIVDYGAGNLNS